jgi:hypothetical protein
MKNQPLAKKLSKPAHPMAGKAVLGAAILLAAGALIFVFQQQIMTTQSTPPLNMTPSTMPTTAPTNSPSQIVWQINTTNGVATYANSDAPIVLQYPSQWGYRDLKGDGVTFKQNPTQGDSTYNIYISWVGSFGDPQCTTRPEIQLKNEKLPACEYADSVGNDRMQIDKITPSLNLFIRTTTSKTVSREEILQILSTLSFTK